MTTDQSPLDHPAWKAAEGLLTVLRELNAADGDFALDVGDRADYLPYRRTRLAMEATLELIFLATGHSPSEMWAQAVIEGSTESGESLTHSYTWLIDSPTYGRDGALHR